MNIHANYLQDLGVLVHERAVEARRQAAAVRSAPSADVAFDLGYWQAYWEVLSLMVNQAGAFQLPLQDIGLDGWEPDRELSPPSV